MFVLHYSDLFFFDSMICINVTIDLFYLSVEVIVYLVEIFSELK